MTDRITLHFCLFNEYLRTRALERRSILTFTRAEMVGDLGALESRLSTLLQSTGQRQESGILPEKDQVRDLGSCESLLCW